MNNREFEFGNYATRLKFWKQTHILPFLYIDLAYYTLKNNILQVDF